MTQITVTSGRPDTFPIGRKTLYYVAGASSCTFVTEADLVNPDSNVLAIPGINISLIKATKTNIERTFFGINSGQGGSQPKSHPSLQEYGFGIARSHDNSGLSWKDINPSSGVFYWDNLDPWLDRNKADGIKSLFTVYQTPTWASARPTGKGPYSSLGWNAEPADFNNLTIFITELVKHCNTRGTPLYALEVWNEPNWVSKTNRSGTISSSTSSTTVTASSGFTSYAGLDIEIWSGTTYIGTVLSVQSDTSLTLKANAAATVSNASVISGARYYSGTVGNLAIMCKTVNQAAKAIDPTILITSPALTGWDAPTGTNDSPATYFTAMVNASDGAGGTLKDWVDVIAQHSYGAATTILTRLASMKSSMATNSITLPIVDTETGTNDTASVSDLTVYQFAVRTYIVAALSGFKFVCLYQLGDVGIYGYSFKSRPNVVSRLKQFIDLICTYGIDSAGFISDGTVCFSINGKTYIV